MKILNLLLVFLATFVVASAVFSLCGCETEPMRFDSTAKFQGNVQYFRDYKGNCFAVLGIRRTGSLEMTGIGLSLVPDENCK